MGRRRRDRQDWSEEPLSGSEGDSGGEQGQAEVHQGRHGQGRGDEGWSDELAPVRCASRDYIEWT